MNLHPADVFALNHLSLIAAVGVIGGLYLFVCGFRVLVRKRLLANTPTPKIRSASLGLVEVNGIATGPYVLNTPIAGIPCYLYRTTVWQKSDEGRNSEWKKAAEETLHVPFFLDDGTGQLLIQPQGAELDLHADLRQSYSDTIFSPHATPGTLAFLARHGVAPDNKIKVEECSIRPQSPLFVVGTLAENPGVDVAPASPNIEGAPTGSRATTGYNAAATQPAEVIRLSEPAPPAGATPVTQQAKIAAALAKAGITNATAWEAAGVIPRRAADTPRVSAIAINRESQCQNPQQAAFNLHPPVVLMKGENNPAFMISWHSQRELVRSLAWKSATMVWGGGALALIGLYVLLTQMGAL